ncbi:hypothetical protein [Brevibacillus thermoruber]|uniref:hypothetical protein n=1 Tax=Brevibacillus thermoruber TaxID=33942 RepID=UPI00068A13DF|nr:hypothetical protein [Brevibacillus thermoruber]
MFSFFNKKKQPSVTRTNRTLSIDSINYVGRYTVSSNGKYTLTWCDGRYLLLENDQIIVDGKMKRPDDGIVTDDGVFVLIDLGSGTSGTFYAFNNAGDLLVKKAVRANIYNAGISRDGKFSVFQTAHSDNSSGNTLYFFELNSGNLIWKATPEKGWANSYEFDTDNCQLHLIYDDFRVSYDFNGKLLSFA